MSFLGLGKRPLSLIARCIAPSALVVPYTLAWVCKAHDCGDNQVYVLFAPGAKQAWGLMILNGDNRSWLGRPDTAIQAAILSGVE